MMNDKLATKYKQMYRMSVTKVLFWLKRKNSVKSSYHYFNSTVEFFKKSRWLAVNHLQQAFISWLNITARGSRFFSKVMPVQVFITFVCSTYIFKTFLLNMSNSKLSLYTCLLFVNILFLANIYPLAVVCKHEEIVFPNHDLYYFCSQACLHYREPPFSFFFLVAMTVQQKFLLFLGEVPENCYYYYHLLLLLII